MYCKFCMNSIADGEKVCPYCGKKQDLPELPHHLPSGTVLQGKYAVGAAIGEGGFGITYVGKNTLLDMKVAIKEFFPNGFVRRDSLQSKTVTDLSTGGSNVFEKGKKRFLDEARMLGRFSREGGIVSVHDFFEENDTAYIVMEFLEGQTLADYLEKKKVLSPEETLALLKPAMKTLEKVHKSGLIHRDISPDNIMLTDSGVKLLDFGAARDAGGEKSLSVMLKHGYAPIEQYSRKGEQGPWTDVYALCATMYKCVTGVTPDEATDRVDEDELKPPSAYVPNVGKTFENALLKGLSVRAKNRYQSVSELLAALEGKDQPAAAVIIPAAATAAARGAGSAPTDPDKTVYGGAEGKVDPDKTVFGGVEDKADPDKTVYGGAEEKADPDKTVFGGAEDKADPDKTVYGGAEKQGDLDKTVFGGAPQYQPDPDKTVYGGDETPVGEAYYVQDESPAPQKKKSKKGLIIALIAAVLVIAGVMIALFAMGVFDQKGETSETTQTSANGEKPNGEKPNGGETQTAPADATASAPAGATETEESGAATETPGVHTHAFGEWAVVKQPTCTEAGSKERVCSCGEKETEAIAATGHSYGDWVLTKPATDAEDGVETKTCSVCGDKITRSVDMIKHNYKATVTKPTCTEQGYTTYVCSDCGKSYVDDYVPATGHTVAVDKAVSATCTEAGKTEGSHCSVCGAVIVAQTSVPATGHSYGTPTFTWSGYTATAKRTCSGCGKTESLTPTVTNSVTKETTCAATGTRTYTAKVTVDGKTYTDQKTETIAKTNNHSYGTPSFSWSGYTATAKRTCSVCGATTTLTPTVTNSVTKEATCAATGTRTYTAKVTVDGYSYTDTKTETIAATGIHTYGAPTFTWSGYTATAKRTCSGCGKTESLTPTVTNSVTKEATCAATGTRTYTAKVTVDGKNYTDTKTETIAATGNHTYGAPTFTWNGYSATAKRTCSGCGKTESLTPTVTNSVTKEASCAATGTRTYTAKVTVDGKNYTDTKTETIAALGHSYVNGTCTRCGAIDPDLQQGDVIKFGSYEQDNKTSNGKEEIEWIVLDVADGKALLLSKYALDCKKYNETFTDVTWETCTLRTWLNETFYNTAFGSAEKSKIVSTTLTNANNPKYGTSGGKSTTDKVFLLSIDEENRYFSSDSARMCAPTDYAKAQGAWTNSDYTTGGRAAGWWWLRSPGYYSFNAASVYYDGSVRDVYDVNNRMFAVRPALWIDL